MAAGKRRQKILGLLQALAVLAIAAACIGLLFRYAAYGQQMNAGQSQETSVSESGAGHQTTVGQSQGNALQQEPLVLPERIRVQILGSCFEEELHREVAFRSAEALTVTFIQLNAKESDAVQTIPPGQTLRIQAKQVKKNQAVCVEAANGSAIAFENLERACGTPEYQGVFYLYRVGNRLAAVNELPLEDYLCSVVSSEMPSDYPLEAQKAQAVCARTYATICAARKSEHVFFADLNDSTAFQVYNNYHETETSRQAAAETAGQVLPLPEVQYYSTSCLTEQETTLDEEKAFRDFLRREPPAEAEYRSPWLRWEAKLPLAPLLERLRADYGFADDVLEQLTVEERRGDGQIQKLCLSGPEASVTAEGEYQIRKLLGFSQTQYRLRDGSAAQDMQLLPSAFFYADESDLRGCDAVVLHGGGYGHGNGMSQCGAAAMAEQGKDYWEILNYYYGAEHPGEQ